jgi:hypothetical protein
MLGGRMPWVLVGLALSLCYVCGHAARKVSVLHFAWQACHVLKLPCISAQCGGL